MTIKMFLASSIVELYDERNAIGDLFDRLNQACRMKYREYRPESFGKMHNNSAAENPYMFLVMQTRTQLSQNSYYPYLKATDDSHLSKDDMGQRLIFGDEHIICNNSSYQRRRNKDDSVVETIIIPQNKDGIDTEDRITILKNYIKANF